MPSITTQDLQDIAVKCASDFFNSGTPLNASLSKEASYRGLNSDQLKRAVEATNTLTYLKSIESASDRTSEFPVADYNDIIKLAFVPDTTQMPELDDKPVPSGVEQEDLLKKASDRLAYSLPEMTEPEKLYQLNKQAAINHRALENLYEKFNDNNQSLLKLAGSLRNDSELMEHLSGSSATEQEFEKVSQLLGVRGERLDYAKGMFKQAALNEVETFLSGYRQAFEFKSEIEKRASWEKQAYGILWSAARRVAQYVGKTGLGQAASTMAKGVGSVARNVAGNVSSQGVTKGLGKTLGQGTAKAITAPFSLAGKAIMTPIKGISGAAGKGINNAAASTSLGKDLGMKVRPQSPNFKRNLAIAGTLGGAAFDAAAYTPKVDPANDHSGSVWGALNN